MSGVTAHAYLLALGRAYGQRIADPLPQRMPAGGDTLLAPYKPWAYDDSTEAELVNDAMYVTPSPPPPPPRPAQFVALSSSEPNK